MINISGYNRNYKDGNIQCTELKITSSSGITSTSRLVWEFTTSGNTTDTRTFKPAKDAYGFYKILGGSQTYTWTKAPGKVTAEDTATGEQHIYFVNFPTSSYASLGTYYLYDPILPTPTALNVSNITSDSATISWTAITNASSYQITYTPSGGSPTIVTSATNSVDLVALLEVTTYSVEIVAVGNGTTYLDSSASDVLSFTTIHKLDTPTGLSIANNAVITTTAKQTVTWNAVTHASSYKLEYKKSTDTNWTEKNVSGSTTSSFTSHSRNTIYDYRVTALGDNTNYDDSAPTAIVSKRTKQQLATPTGLTCTSKTANSLTCTWNAVSGTKTYYLGYKTASSSSYSYVQTASTSATITGLTEGTAYTLRIGARVATDGTNYDGSSYSSTITKTTLSLLTPPTGLTHDRVTSTSARVGWNAVTNATDYKVEYRAQGATNWTED